MVRKHGWRWGAGRKEGKKCPLSSEEKGPGKVMEEIRKSDKRWWLLLLLLLLLLAVQYSGTSG